MPNASIFRLNISFSQYNTYNIAITFSGTLNCCFDSFLSMPDLLELLRSIRGLICFCNTSRRPLKVHGGRHVSNIPQWPHPRKLPITPPSATKVDADIRFVKQQGWFFTEIPLEIRRRIYDFALGEEVILLSIPDQDLQVQRCLEPDRSMCLKELGEETTQKGEGSADSKLRISVALLCSCRQV